MYRFPSSQTSGSTPLPLLSAFLILVWNKRFAFLPTPWLFGFITAAVGTCSPSNVDAETDNPWGSPSSYSSSPVLAELQVQGEISETKVKDCRDCSRFRALVLAKDLSLVSQHPLGSPQSFLSPDPLLCLSSSDAIHAPCMHKVHMGICGQNTHNIN